MINIIKHGDNKILQEYTMVCPACGCTFTYNNEDISSYDTTDIVRCPECKEYCRHIDRETKTAKELIVKEVMDNFNFSAVERFMKCNDWTWGKEIPDLDTIKDMAKRLLEEAYDKKTTIATSGFIAEYLSDNEEESLQLFFGEYVNRIFINPNTKDIKYY